MFGSSVTFLCPSFQLPIVSVPPHYSRFSSFIWYICHIINNKIRNLYSVSIPNTHTSRFGSSCHIWEKSMQYLSFWLWFIWFHMMMSSSMYFPSYDIILLFFLRLCERNACIYVKHIFFIYLSVGRKHKLSISPAGMVFSRGHRRTPLDDSCLAQRTATRDSDLILISWWNRYSHLTDQATETGAAQ